MVWKFISLLCARVCARANTIQVPTCTSWPRLTKSCFKGNNKFPTPGWIMSDMRLGYALGPKLPWVAWGSFSTNLACAGYAPATFLASRLDPARIWRNPTRYTTSTLWIGDRVTQLDAPGTMARHFFHNIPMRLGMHPIYIYIYISATALCAKA